MSVYSRTAVIQAVLLRASSMSVYSLRLLPDLRPRLVDPLWFDVDRPVDLNAELKVGPDNCRVSILVATRTYLQ